MARRLPTFSRRRPLRARSEPRRFDHAGELAPTASRAQDASIGDRQSLLQSLTEENAMLARELGRVQQRCTRWRDCAGQVERLEARLMCARAEDIVKTTLIAVLCDALETPRPSSAAVDAPTPTCAADPRQPAPPAARLAHRRVLCVGGRTRQVPIYRDMVERGGGRFAHVDGSSTDDLHRLEQALADADVVILQAGYVCQGACREVEDHCRRTGICCIRLDKPCALGFARSLTQAIDRVAA